MEYRYIDATTGTARRTGTTARAAAALLVAALVACGGGGEPGYPSPPPPPPDLAGARIMLLPAQAGSPAQLDAELAFWLTDRAAHTEWLLPEQLQRTVDRSPAWRVRLDALPRRLVDAGGGDMRLTDPLYGALRRLGAIEDTNTALVPVSSRVVSDSVGVAMELTAALVDVRAGRVVWLGSVRGEGVTGDASPIASAAEALARALVPL